MVAGTPPQAQLVLNFSPLSHREHTTIFIMADQSRSEIIKGNPIGAGLDSFRVSFNAVCADTGIRCTPDALGRLDQKGRIKTTDTDTVLF